MGKLVSRLYIEEGADIAKEIYFALVMDRASERIMVGASAAGGMEIEEISAKQPETIIRISVDPAVGMQQFQAREVALIRLEPETSASWCRPSWAAIAPCVISTPR